MMQNMCCIDPSTPPTMFMYAQVEEPDNLFLFLHITNRIMTDLHTFMLDESILKQILHRLGARENKYIYNDYVYENQWFRPLVDGMADTRHSVQRQWTQCQASREFTTLFALGLHVYPIPTLSWTSSYGHKQQLFPMQDKDYIFP